MDKIKKLLQDISIKSDLINVLLGIALIVSLILIFLLPNNPYAILSACISGGFMNMMSGIKYMKEPVRRSTGVMFFFMGIVVIIMGFIIVEVLKAA